MIDGFIQTGHEKRRLFLSRYDLVTELRSSAVQPGLDFPETESVRPRQEVTRDYSETTRGLSSSAASL